MAKRNEVKSWDSLSLPLTLQEATISFPKGYGYVSHTAYFFSEKFRQKTARGGRKTEEKVIAPDQESITDDGEPYLTSGNHAFYIGKFFPKSWKEKLVDILGWPGADGNKKSENNDTEKSPGNHIYSGEFIEASLRYLVAHLQDDQSVQVVVGPVLSELINGKQDLAGALSTEDEINLIREIFYRIDSPTRRSLVVHNLAKMPLHRPLFTTLRKNQDALTGKCDVGKVLEGVDGLLESPANSLQIAACLYRAAKESHDLALKLRATVPGRLRVDLENEQGRDAMNYGILEIAIRLAEILNGRNIHLGAERPAVYDDIIVEILKGSHGRFSSVKSLGALLSLFEGIPFRTLHVNNKNNPQVLSGIRDRARARLAIIGLMMATVVGGGVKGKDIYSEYKQNEIRTLVDNALAEDLKNVEFVGKNQLPIDREQNVAIFRSITDQLLELVALRYDISNSGLETLRPQLMDYLLTQFSLLPAINNDESLRVRTADEFIKANKRVLMAQGIDVGKPKEIEQ